MGRGGGAVRGQVRKQRSSGLPVADGTGCAADPASAEVQRQVAGETCGRESVSAVFHWNEGVRSLPIWSVHADEGDFVPINDVQRKEVESEEGSGFDFEW